MLCASPRGSAGVRDRLRRFRVESPEQSWLTAVRAHGADAAVLSVVTTADHPRARQTTQELRAHLPDLLIACGGAHGTSLAADVHELPSGITDAAQALDALLHP